MQSNQHPVQPVTLTTQSPSTRVRRTRQQWMQIVERYHRSDSTQAVFCRENQLSLATFSKWKQRLESESNTDFVSVTPEELPKVDTPLGGLQIRLTLGEGVVLELSKS